MNHEVPVTIRPAPIFLGYCLQLLLPRPDWLADPRVKTIASVSDCFALRPTEWIQRWDFNIATGFYDNPDRAASAFDPANNNAPYRLFAYDFYPLRFDIHGGIVEVDPQKAFGVEFDPSSRPTIIPGFRFLGYDVVELWADNRPGHADASRPLNNGRCDGA
ncbi:MAG: hypothetical protein ACKVW3_04490 [Phycisphaerales bacterium]